MPAAVWFTRGLANTFDALELIRREDPDRQAIRLVASHTDPQALVLQAADLALIEPAGAGLSDRAYTDWVLNHALAHGIALVIAQRRRPAMARQVSRFAQAGIRLVVAAPAETLAVLEDKARFYAECQTAGLAVAPFAVFQDAAGFAAAHAALAPQARQLCIKPARSIYGHGFRILAEAPDELALLVGGNHITIDVERFRALLPTGPRHSVPRPVTWLLMAYLDGAERSLDVLAQDGRLVAAVVRRKGGGGQWLEGPEPQAGGPALALAAATVAHFRLNGLVNIQTRDWQGRPWLLEVNDRMAGGIAYGAASLNLPWWGVRHLLGAVEAHAIPAPLTGLRVTVRSRAILHQALPAA